MTEEAPITDAIPATLPAAVNDAPVESTVPPIDAAGLAPAETEHHYHGLLPRLLKLIEKDYDAVKAWIEQEEAKL